MSAVLPVNIAGIALIVLAAGLFIADAFTPSHGVLTGGAVTSLLFGLFLLFDRTDPVFQTAEKLVQAAAMISAQPIALQLRFLQTMSEIASENNTTTFLPLPLELFTPFLKQAADTGAAKG